MSALKKILAFKFVGTIMNTHVTLYKIQKRIPVASVSWYCLNIFKVGGETFLKVPVQ